MELRFPRCSKSIKGPRILPFIVAKDVIISIISDDSEIHRIRRVPMTIECLSHQNSDRECRTVEDVHRSETPHNTALQFRSWFFTQPNQRTFRRCCQLVSASGANSAPLGISRAANRMQSPIHSIHSKFWRPGSGRSATYQKLPIAGHHGPADLIIAGPCKSQPGDCWPESQLNCRRDARAWFATAKSPTQFYLFS
jgi:hypothetical protein